MKILTKNSFKKNCGQNIKIKKYTLILLNNYFKCCKYCMVKIKLKLFNIFTSSLSKFDQVLSVKIIVENSIFLKREKTKYKKYDFSCKFSFLGHFNIMKPES